MYLSAAIGATDHHLNLFCTKCIFFNSNYRAPIHQSHLSFELDTTLVTPLLLADELLLLPLLLAAHLHLPHLADRLQRLVLLFTNRLPPHLAQKTVLVVLDHIRRSQVALGF